jgi:hypothetical protein
MKAYRFDALTRSVDVKLPRRATLSGLLGIGLAALFTGPAREAAGAKKKCKNGKKRCGGRCVNLKTSRSNCGQCGNTCPDNAVCTDGVDFATDPANCGRCGNVCARGECFNGARSCRRDHPEDCPGGCDCVPRGDGGAACGFISVDTTCYETFTDADCPLGSICITGVGLCTAPCLA